MDSKCPECGSTKKVKAGTVIRRKKGKMQRYQCVECGLYTFGDPVGNEEQ
jgi:transposase-like protein